MACVGYAKRRVRRMILESSANAEAQTVMCTALQKVDSFTAPLVQTQYTQFIILVYLFLIGLSWDCIGWYRENQRNGPSLHELILTQARVSRVS